MKSYQINTAFILVRVLLGLVEVEVLRDSALTYRPVLCDSLGEEVLIVRDDNDAALERGQRIDECVDRFHVEMVGRLLRKSRNKKIDDKL